MENYDITESVEVLPCPFRKHRKERRPKMHHIKNRNYESGLYAVTCPVCGIRGMYALTEERAIMNWNSRNEADIVRCKDCVDMLKVPVRKGPSEIQIEYRCESEQWSTASLMPTHSVEPDGFCAWGERKSEIDLIKEGVEHVRAKWPNALRMLEDS